MRAKSHRRDRTGPTFADATVWIAAGAEPTDPTPEPAIIERAAVVLERSALPRQPAGVPMSGVLERAVG